jgi:hypothetical protein
MGFAVKARRPRMGYRFKIISLPCTNPAEASCIIERPGALRNPSLCFVEEANKLFNAEGAEESMGAWGHLVLVLVLLLVLVLEKAVSYQPSAIGQTALGARGRGRMGAPRAHTRARTRARKELFF